MVDKLKNLISVKSLVTLALTAVVCVLAIKGQFDIKDIYLMIIAFYFGTQTEKAKSVNVVSSEEQGEN